MTAPSRPSGRVPDAERAATDPGRPGYADQPDHVAPDGQRIVDQRIESQEEDEAIQRSADRMTTVAREQREQEPSTRFWSSRHAQIGPLLALLAGVFTLAIRTWPIATPQGRGGVGTAWFICATLAGLLYIAGFFLADRHWRRARTVLISGAVLHLLVGSLAAMVIDAQDVASVWQALPFDAVPAILAVVAAFLISPPPGERR